MVLFKIKEQSAEKLKSDDLLKKMRFKMMLKYFKKLRLNKNIAEAIKSQEASISSSLIIKKLCLTYKNKSSNIDRRISVNLNLLNGFYDIRLLEKGFLCLSQRAKGVKFLKQRFM